MSEAERVALGQTIAGKNQYKVLASVMSNFGQASEAATTAMQSSGSAAEENARYMESWEAATTKLSAAWENLSTALISGGINKLVDTLANIVQYLSESEVAVQVLKTLLVGGGIWGGAQLLQATKIIDVISSQFTNLIALFKMMKMQGATLPKVFAALGGEAGAFAGAMSASLPIILGIVGAAALLIPLFKKIKESADFDLQADELDNIKDSYSEMDKRLEELKAYHGDLTEAEKEELELLQLQLDAYKAIKEHQQDKTEKALHRQYRKATRTEAEYMNVTGMASPVFVNDKSVKQWYAINEMMESGRVGTRAFQDALQSFVGDWDTLVATLKRAKEAGVELKEEEQTLINRYDYAVKLLSNYSKSLDSSSNSSDTLTKSQLKAAQSVLSFTDAIVQAAEMGGEGGDYDAMFQGYTKAFDTLTSEFEAGRIGSKALEGALSSLVDTETYANFVQADYNGKMEILRDIMPQLTSMFGDADSAGFGYLTVMKQLADANGNIIDSSGALVGNIQSINGQISYSIKDFSGLADSLNVSEGALFSMIEAGKVMGASFSFNAQDLVRNFREVGITVQKTKDGLYSIDWSALSEGLSETGAYSAEQLEAVKQVLLDVDGIELTNITEENVGLEEEFKKVQDAANEANTTADAMNDVDYTPAAKKLGILAQAFDSVKTSAEAAAKASASIGAPEAAPKASGDSSFKGGLALVNDGRPVNGSAKELIVQDGRAFMMPSEPSLVNLKKGATIYNASETQKIIGGIPAFRKGYKPTITNTGGEILQTFIAPDYGIGGGGDVPDDSGGGRRSSSPTEATKNAKEIFDEWLRVKKHALAMDEITEQEYYDSLEEMNEKYFANSKEYEDDYWKYQEEIYRFRKNQLEDENDLLQKQIDLEEALNNLAQAKASKKYVYSSGQFGYLQDIDAVSAANQRLREVRGYANGTTDAKAGLSLVGEKGAELRVLGSHDGIISSDITRNLMRIGTMGISGISQGRQESYMFNIGSVKLEKVNDVDGLFNGLKNLALQTALKHA